MTIKFLQQCIVAVIPLRRNHHLLHTHTSAPHRELVPPVILLFRQLKQSLRRHLILPLCRRKRTPRRQLQPIHAPHIGRQVLILIRDGHDPNVHHTKPLNMSTYNIGTPARLEIFSIGRQGHSQHPHHQLTTPATPTFFSRLTRHILYITPPQLIRPPVFNLVTYQPHPREMKALIRLL